MSGKGRNTGPVRFRKMVKSKRFLVTYITSSKNERTILVMAKTENLARNHVYAILGKTATILSVQEAS